MIDLLLSVQNTLWETLFGKEADELQKSTESENEYMINEFEPLVNRFISVPRDYGSFNVSSFAAGVIKGVLDSAGFPAEVETHAGTEIRGVTFLIKFEEHVTEREAKLERGE